MAAWVCGNMLAAFTCPLGLPLAVQMCTKRWAAVDCACLPHQWLVLMVARWRFGWCACSCNARQASLSARYGTLALVHDLQSLSLEAASKGLQSWRTLCSVVIM